MKKNNKKYALKEMSKVKIIDRRSEKNIKNEREFLSKLHHPFIVNMACAFQDYENLYLVMDLLTGGDLRYHLCLLQKFSEDETKFFFACLLLGLEYIHGNNIIHRDIKPENLVCEENGYIRITDFGVAKIKKEDNSSETSGTPGYMAPEVLFAQSHSFPVDFFAIGVMGYEFMFGERPYLGKNRKEIKHLVIKKQAKINLENVPDGWSYESVDFINKCLKRRWMKRLGGTKGIQELKNHSWFRNYNWDKLYNKKKKAPFMPKRGGNYDKRYCEAVEKISDKTRERYQKYKNQTNFLYIFEEYTYINYELIPGNFVETNTRVTTKTTNTKASKMQSPINYMSNSADINNDIFSNKKLSNAIKNFRKHLNDGEIENEKEELMINTIRTPLNQNKNNLNFEIDPHFKFKIEKKEKSENKPKMFANNSIYKNYNNIVYGIKKLASSTINKIKPNSRSSSVDISNSNLKNNLYKNISYLKYPKKDNNIKYNLNERNLNDFNNGSLSNPTRDKLTYKLYKNNSYVGNIKLIDKNKKKEASVIELGENNNNSNNNNYLSLKKNNFIQLRKFNNANNFYYLPNLNKEMNLNMQRNKKKFSLNNLDPMIMSPRNKFEFNNKDNNLNLKSRNKFFLSPTNKILRKSESSFFIKTPINSGIYDLNHNSNINLKDTGELNNNNINDNFYSTFIKKNINNFSNRVFKKRKK